VRQQILDDVALERRGIMGFFTGDLDVEQGLQEAALTQALELE
jgi:hypothetical protein